MPRLFEQFNLKNEDSLPGRSSAQLRLWSATKKVKFGDHPNKNKYKSQYFLKKVENGRHEVAIMEFYRLLIPSQPKFRLIQDTWHLSNYVQSTAIPGQPALYMEENDFLNKRSITNYGTSTGFKGLGAIECISLLILYTEDTYLGNLIVNDENQLFKIDGKYVYWQPLNLTQLEMLNNDVKKFNNINEIYSQEFNQVLLRYLVLPEAIMEAFSQKYQLTNENKQTLFSNQIYLRHLSRTLNHQGQSFFHQFINYGLSEQAFEDLKRYIPHLNHFITSGKNRLLSHDIETSVFQNFAKLQQCLHNPFSMREFSDLQIQQKELIHKLSYIKKEVIQQIQEVSLIDRTGLLKLKHLCEKFFGQYHDALDYPTMVKKFKKEIEQHIKCFQIHQQTIRYITIFRPIDEQLSGLLLLLMSFGLILLAYESISHYAHQFFIKKQYLPEASVTKRLTNLLS